MNTPFGTPSGSMEDMSYATTTARETSERFQSPLAAIVVTVASVVLLFTFQFFALIGYFIWKMIASGRMPDLAQPDLAMTLVAIGSTFPAHIATLWICRMVLTAGGRRPLFSSPLWQWHDQFKWVHAVGLAFLMIGAAMLLEKVLPHRETDLEKILRLGSSIRYVVAALAVLTAPLVEEMVYRGVLYAGLERQYGRRTAIIAATATFAAIHVPQYWGSVAAISAILLLSLVLTLLRAYTGRLLPCVATHLVYNGIQAVALIVGGDSLLKKSGEAAVSLITNGLALDHAISYLMVFL